ncbi:MAG: 7,8-didemethyl-8-hydroxy-5-deazariboflavin synthase CofG, partial [Lysobacterales bacterium]
MLQAEENSGFALWGLVPVKLLARSKQRLEPSLGPKRPGLARAMLTDVLRALLASREVDRVAVVTADAQVKALAKKLGVTVIDEAGAKGMRGAIARGLDEIRRAGGEQAFIIHADIPLSTGTELDRVLGEYRRLRRAGNADLVAAVPSHDRNGTNLLVFDTARPLPLKYGPDSFRLHRDAARASGRPFVTLHSDALALDIDDEQDLQRFIAVCRSDAGCRSTASWRYLEANPIHQVVLTQDKPMQAKNPTANPDHSEPLELPQLLQLSDTLGLEELCGRARDLRDRGHGDIVTYSKKVFIPLTRLCRDFCHYCTFATTPKRLSSAYLSADEAVEIARQGAEMGCKEALFTLGEKPELRHAVARQALADMGFATTLEYVAHVAERVLSETGLLPHINAGCMSADEVAMLRPVSASMGIMLESSAERLCEKGQVHYGSPDKQPAVRIETIAEAGRQSVPFTTGILIGIGETRVERLESLLAIRALHREYGHIQEVIVQNFVPKDDTKMAAVEPPGMDELRWTIAMARIVFGPEMSIQAPPNLSPGKLVPLLDAGINDWGGVSPLTPDHVNPESPWPQLAALADETAAGGKLLQERL